MARPSEIDQRGVLGPRCSTGDMPESMRTPASEIDGTGGVSASPTPASPGAWVGVLGVCGVPGGWVGLPGCDGPVGDGGVLGDGAPGDGVPGVGVGDGDGALGDGVGASGTLAPGPPGIAWPGCSPAGGGVGAVCGSGAGAWDGAVAAPWLLWWQAR